jgi:hypothetical protein
MDIKSRLAPTLYRAQRWLVLVFLIIGVAVGYVNFRFGIREIFVMTSDEGLRTVTTIFGGYLLLLPLTLVGLRFRRTSSGILFAGTIAAFLCGVLPLDPGATAYMLGRFVLPNVAVAILMMLSAVRAPEYV